MGAEGQCAPTTEERLAKLEAQLGQLFEFIDAGNKRMGLDVPDPRDETTAPVIPLRRVR